MPEVQNHNWFVRPIMHKRRQSFDYGTGISQEAVSCELRLTV